MANFEDIVAKSKVLLTEGGVVERIKRNPSVDLDPHIAHSGLIDAEIYPKLIFYMVNCVHPTIFEQAISKEINFPTG